MSPSAGTRVGSSIDILAQASDNVGVTRVEFLYHIDQRPLTAFQRMDPPTYIGTRYASPYSFHWNDVPRLCPALVSLYAWAYDACDNVGEAPLIQVSVCN